MKIHEYNEMMRYLTRPASPSMDQGPTDDVIPQEQKPKTFYGKDSVMPSFDGMEDPKALEDYRQIELADGGVVEREGFDNGTDPNELTPLKRRELIKETILEELNKFEKNKIFPNEKYALSLDNISDIVKEKTGKSITPSIVSEESKKLPLKDKERFRYLFAGETPSNLPIEEQKLFAKNYNKKTISQLARQITGLPTENKITKAKRMQLFRHAAYQAQLENIYSQEVKRGTRPKGSVLSTEKGFLKYAKDSKDLMKLDPKTYENIPLSTLDYRLRKAIQFNNVAGAFGKGVPKMLKPSFEHFEGIVAGKIIKNPDALKKVGITTRDFNWKVMGGRSKTSIYKNIKTELETAMASLKLNDPKTAKESLNTVNKLYDDVAKKLKTVDRKKLPKYNLTKNSIKEINLKPIELNTTKRLANQLDEYVRFVAAGPKNLVKQIKQPNLVKAVEMAQKGKDKSLKNLIKSRVPDVKNKKLFSKIPGITDLFEMAESIPDDFKKAKYLSSGLKTLGIAAAPLVVYDLYSAFKEGKPLLEVLEQGFVGTDVIGGTKRLISLSPKGKEARAIVKKAEMDDQIAQDDTFLDTDFTMLPVESDLTLEGAEKKYKEEAQKVSEQEALQNKQRGENRFNLFTTEEPKPIELNKGGLVAQYFGIVPNRGRVGLKT